MEKINNKITDFFELTRAYSLLMSLAPWFLVLMWLQKFSLSVLDVLLSFFGVICVHLGTNLLDDFLDVKRELNKGKDFCTIDFGNIDNKARLILNGTFSLSDVKKIIAVLYLIAVIIGVYYTIKVGISIPLITIVAALLCATYPVSSKYYLDELSVALIFGPLLMSGASLALSGRLQTNILFMSVSVGLLTAVLLHTHAIMDWEYDERAQKNTFCRLFKDKDNAILALKIMIILAYANVVICVNCGVMHKNALYVFLTLPVAVELIKSIKDYVKIKDVKFIPKWYLGPMEDWDRVQKNKMEFFMYRFYLARNLGFLFCFFAALACYMR